MRWALIDSENIVENVVIWGGGASLWPDMLTVQLETEEPCSPGWIYDPSATPRFFEPNG